MAVVINKRLAQARLSAPLRPRPHFVAQTKRLRAGPFPGPGKSDRSAGRSPGSRIIAPASPSQALAQWERHKVTRDAGANRLQLQGQLRN